MWGVGLGEGERGELGLVNKVKKVYLDLIKEKNRTQLQGFCNLLGFPFWFPLPQERNGLTVMLDQGYFLEDAIFGLVAWFQGTPCRLRNG